MQAYVKNLFFFWSDIKISYFKCPWEEYYQCRENECNNFWEQKKIPAKHNIESCKYFRREIFLLSNGSHKNEYIIIICIIIIASYFIYDTGSLFQYIDIGYGA